MNSNLKFSIIIPVYNVEKYLEECVESCEQQDIPHDEYEIITVNDGSTDGSLDLLLKLQSKYDNISIISQQNKGLSAARNTGLNAAKGKYIWFIDSDDYIAHNVLSDLDRILSDNNVDCLNIGFHKVFGIDKDRDTIKQIHISEVRAGMQLMKDELNCSFYAWSFIFNRDFFVDNGYFFKEGLLYEDLQLIPKILRQTRKTVSYNAILYHYRQRQDSIAHTVNDKMLHSFYYIIEDYSDYIHCLNEKKEIEYFNFLIEKIKIMLAVIIGKINKEKDRTDAIDLFRRKFASIAICNRMSTKEKLFARLYNVFPSLLFALLSYRQIFR